MPREGYKSLTLTERAYDRLVAAQKELLSRGTNTLPEKLRPKGAYGPSEVLEIALGLLEKQIRGRR